MAEDSRVVVAGEKAIEHVRRLAVGRVHALPYQELRQHRPDRGEVEEADDFERERLAVRVLIKPVTPLLPAQLGEERRALLRVELVGRVLLEQRLGRLEVRREALVDVRIRHRQRRETRRPAPADVDQDLAVDQIAHRPAEFRVVERRPLAVQVERRRPPVDVAVGKLLSGMGDDVGICREHGRECRHLQAGREVDCVGDEALGELLLAGVGQEHDPLDSRQLRDPSGYAPPAIPPVEHFLGRRDVHHLPGTGRDRPFL